VSESSGARILIVDDNVLALETIQEILERQGYKVIGRAMNGSQAVDLVEELTPDLVLMDIEMPRLNGLEAARQIQDRCPTPVVMLTAHDAPDLVAQAGEVGVMSYILKPPRPDVVTLVLPLALARFQELQELRRVNDELAHALEEVKTLSGLLPICANCKRIRDDEGYWHHVEHYIQSHSQARFSHGICPSCMQLLYGDLPGGSEAE
jgi:AmiR/NasT family two-component response regulator